MKPFPALHAGCALATALAIIAAGFHPSAARAAVYLENLDHVVDNTAPINATTSGGQSFLTDNSASGFYLTAITFSLGDPPHSTNVTVDSGEIHPALPPPPGGFTISLYANGANNTPGTLIETLSGNDNPATPGNYTYTSVGTFLAPNTIYWAIAEVDPISSSEYYLNYTASTVFNGTWSTIGWTYRDDPGNPWWAPDLTEPDMISVSATPVPEPAVSAGVLAVAAVTTVVLRRRKRRLTA